jgi:bifunctional NMN adenylyltransferase/nudix hydrolase
MSDLRNIGVLVMRLQTTAPTRAHLALIQDVLDNSDQTVIVFGEAPIRLDHRNPLTAEARIRLLAPALPQGIEYLTLRDNRSDEQWSNNLDALLERSYPSDANVITLVGGRDSFLNYYTGTHQSRVFAEIPGVSATDVRQQVYDKKYVPTNNADYIAGYMEGATSGFPTSYQAVDIALLVRAKDGASYRLLVGTREAGGLVRFPGGYTDPMLDQGRENGELFLEGVGVRELFEETNVQLSDTQLEYVASFRVNDWRFRKSVHKIGSTLFAAIVDETKYHAMGQVLSPNDDLHDVAFVDLDSLDELGVTDEHRPLLRAVRRKVEQDRKRIADDFKAPLDAHLAAG